MNIYSPLDCVPANVQEADAASAANWAEMVKEDQVKLIRAWQQSPERERDRERECRCVYTTCYMCQVRGTCLTAHLWSFSG